MARWNIFAPTLPIMQRVRTNRKNEVFFIFFSFFLDVLDIYVCIVKTRVCVCGVIYTHSIAIFEFFRYLLTLLLEVFY